MLFLSGGRNVPLHDQSRKGFRQPDQLGRGCARHLDALVLHAAAFIGSADRRTGDCRPPRCCHQSIASIAAA